MEFPHLGEHCSHRRCNRLDFLPVKCDACDRMFCSEHFSYSNHSCSSAKQKDIQVPVCPLCGEPVPTPRNVSPDHTVGQHIDQFCKSKKPKIFTNECSYNKCKKKELIPVRCPVCNENFCLRHRHATDHNCKGAVHSRRQLLAQAVEKRLKNSNAEAIDHSRSVQGSMTEDEALAQALALSIIEMDENNQDRRLQSRTVTTGASDSTTVDKDKCVLS